jgi:hypothetical protein
MSDISKSALGEKFDAEFEAQVAACKTSEEIKALMQERAVAMGHVVRDKYDPSVLLVNPDAVAQPQKFAKSITVDGQKRIFEANSELELEKSIGDYFRALQGAQATNPERQQTERPRGDDDAQLEAVRKSELE